MAYFQPEYECMDREELKKLQSERLVWQVNRMYERVELFRKRMDEAGLKPSGGNILKNWQEEFKFCLQFNISMV